MVRTVHFQKAAGGYDFAPVLLRTVNFLRDFLEATQNKYSIHPFNEARINLIDGFDEQTLIKPTKLIHTFRIRGAESEERYKNDSLLRGTWYAEHRLKEGIVDGRRKHVDVYLRISFDRESQAVHVEFTTMGLQAHVNKAGGIPAIELNHFSQKTLSAFTARAEHMLTILAPVFMDRNDKAMRRLDKLTKPSGP